jgi:phospholipase A-2-activating protein
MKQSTSSIAMYPQEVTLFEEIFTYLTTVAASSPPSKAPSRLSPAHIEAIISILERWPSSQRFPLIDLSRLIFAFCPESPFDVPGLKAKFLDALFVAAEWEGQEGSSVKVKETNTTLVLKALANAVGERDGGSKEVEAEWLGNVVENVGKIPHDRLVKAQKVAFATVLFK